MTTTYSVAVLLAVHAALDAAMHLGALPDDTMDALTEASCMLERNIYDAPCMCEDDVLAKLSLASAFVGSEGGIASMEIPLIEKIGRDLRAMREREATAMELEAMQHRPRPVVLAAA